MGTNYRKCQTAKKKRKVLRTLGKENLGAEKLRRQAHHAIDRQSNRHRKLKTETMVNAANFTMRTAQVSRCHWGRPPHRDIR